MKNKPYPLYNTLPQIKDLKEMVKSRAGDTPGDVCFSYTDDDGKLVEKTCYDFDREIDALGTYLYSEGFHDKNIAIIGENSYDWLVCFFAITNGGNVVVPIDKDQPEDMAITLLKQSDCDAVIFAGNYTKLKNPPKGLKVYNMSELMNYQAKGTHLISSGDTSFIDYNIDPERLAAIFFTSGTTGISKGVMLSQKNMASDINVACKNFILDGNSLSVLPFHHTFGLITAIFMVFNYRRATYINRSLKYLLKELAVVRPQTLFLVPLFVENFYKRIVQNAKKRGKEKMLKAAMKNSEILLKFGLDFREKFFKEILQTFGGNLEFIICGGAPLNEHYVKAFRAFGIEILNGYGITECSPVLSVNRNHYHRDGSVGQILDGIDIRISEDDEIVVKGDNVMMGYYKDNISTAQAFTEGWYRTGDLGHIDEDGFLFITGREKNLIILSNGENVSPEELEMLVGVVPGVCECVVYSDDKGIVAEIFPEEDYLNNQPHFDAKIAEINKKLPVFKRINSVKLRSSEFPKNSSKKILRNKINVEQQ